jgi:hypothetical protein
VQPNLRPHEAYFIYEGRSFRRLDLLKSVIAASGRKTVGLALDWEERELWQTIELVETVVELSADNDMEDWDE